MSIEAMKQALEALESFREISDFTPAQAVHAITALRTAIEQAEKQEPVEQEPFGYFQYDIRLDAWVQNRINNKGVAFYTKEKT
jgi:hypothetical protein